MSTNNGYNNCKKYKVSIDFNSKKVQGLKTGDIVRRQYFDGTNVIYSLMCVLSYGVDAVAGSTPGTTVNQPYFIGVLLAGDEPINGELLDFVRITNLFDLDRSGALYLTSSDEESPFMDVIDGIGRNCSLCWPESIAGADNIDSVRQYVVLGDGLTKQYRKSIGSESRICHITFDRPSSGFIGLKQDFQQYVAYPEQVLVTYKIKSSTERPVGMSLGYENGLELDGWIDEDIVTTDWTYKVHPVIIQNSGRHLRTVKLDLSNFSSGDEVWVADFNIILLDSVANFQDASRVRVGQLSGIIDPVFGRLDGYGGYLQKLYASNAAHISGTLTAGDENGFGATFYAGKIHRNVFINSLNVNFVSGYSGAPSTLLVNPTGTGGIFCSHNRMTMTAQTAEWWSSHEGKQYCFSCWVYADDICDLRIIMNGSILNVIGLDESGILKWQRVHVVIKLSENERDEDIAISLNPVWGHGTGNLYFTAPQLESGTMVTQYQATDDTLDYTDEYGAWFNRGGIGGTMQNPLIKMNLDNQGSIGTRSQSFLLKQDGSGYFAKQNIRWDVNGNVTFGNQVTLNWDNLSGDIQNAVQGRSIHILGTDIFMEILNSGVSIGNGEFVPQSITLSLEMNNIGDDYTCQWSYSSDNQVYTNIANATSDTFVLTPGNSIWGNHNAITIKCTVTVDQTLYSDTITIKKLLIEGYTVEVTSSFGDTFNNGDCSTELTANIYHQWKELPADYIAENFTFLWHKYLFVNGVWREDAMWWRQEGIDRTQQTIQLDHHMSGRELYTCELLLNAEHPGFVYSYPVVLS